MFDIELSVREFGGQAVVALRGELDLGSTPAVASHLLTAVAACGPLVILDLEDLDNICRAGLGMLLRVRQWVRENGGDLALAAPQASVRGALQATGLADIFSVYPSVEHAAMGMHLARQPMAVNVAEAMGAAGPRCLTSTEATPRAG